MLSFFKKKKIVPHIRLTGVIGNAGRFKQGIDFAGQEELIKKAFSIKKSLAVFGCLPSSAITAPNSVITFGNSSRCLPSLSKSLPIQPKCALIKVVFGCLLKIVCCSFMISSKGGIKFESP